MIFALFLKRMLIGEIVLPTELRIELVEYYFHPVRELCNVRHILLSIYCINLSLAKF